MINPALLVRLRKFRLKKFVKRGGKIKKLPAQKAHKQFMGTPAPSAELHSIGVKETILKAGRTTEKISFKRLLKKFPGQGVKAHKLAQLKGVKKVKSLGKRYNVQGLFSVKDRPKTFYKTKKGSGLPKGMTLQEMGWAPAAELSAEATAVKAAQSPKALTKRYFKTYQKIKTKPKSWTKRASLKQHYRTKVKSELKLAKIDRAIYRSKTVQKYNPKTGKYKTIWSPEKKYDVVSKRWTRTRFPEK
jgi:hypothetical protein